MLNQRKNSKFCQYVAPPPTPTYTHTITHTQNQETVRSHNQNRPIEQVLYTFPNKDCNILFTTDADKVIFADGSYKMLFGINGHYPGPSVVVYEDQQVIY